TISSVSLVQPSAGSLSGDALNGWTFTPASGFIGTVDLAIAVSDGIVTVNDHASFTSGSGPLGTGTSANDRLSGDAESNGLQGLAGDDVIDGMGGDDDINGGPGSDQLRGGAGDDRITGAEHDDILQGGDGDDNLAGDGGDDQLHGGSGDDLLSGGSGDDILSGDGGRDALKGGSGADQLLGGEADDVLLGEEGDDILEGGAGDDLLIGGGGVDVQRGGSGNDSFIAVGNTVSDDVMDGGEGSDTLVTGAQSYSGEGGANYLLASLRNLERLELLPTASADQFSFWTSDLDRLSQRGSRFSIDQINAFAWIGASADASWASETFNFSVRELSRDWPATNWRWLRIAGEGSINLADPRWDPATRYRIRTEAGRQLLNGSENDDWLAAGEADDSLAGHAGDDTLLGEQGDDLLEGGSGNDQLEGNSGIDTLKGGDGDDLLIPGGSNDRVDGDNGDDTIELNWGRIESSAGGGTDYWYDINTTISGSYAGGSGIDTLRLQTYRWPDWSNGRGEGQIIDLRSATLIGFERLEVGTAAVIRLNGSQYSQFTGSIGRSTGYEGVTNLAIDLTAGEELRFSRSAGINSASGPLNITGTSSSFSDILAINSDGVIDLSVTGTRIQGVEGLDLQRGTVVLTAAQWNSFATIRALGEAGKKIIITDGDSLNLSNFSRSNDRNTSVELNLSVAQLNSEQANIFAEKFAIASNSNVAINVIGKGVIATQQWPAAVTIKANQATFAPLSWNGDNTDNSIPLRLLGPFALDGKGGHDTLILNGYTDLSKGSLSQIEVLDLNDQQVSMSGSQFNSFQLIRGRGNISISDDIQLNLNLLQPSAPLRINNSKTNITSMVGTSAGEALDVNAFEQNTANNVIHGLGGDDSLFGREGDDSLAGGDGNDQLEGGSGINTAVFSGPIRDYTWNFVGRALKVEHLNGGRDGTDTLLDIQILRFADTELDIDDITNIFDSGSGANSELGKRNRGKTDYNPTNDIWTLDSDWDTWSLPLIAHSRIEITKTIAEGSKAGAQVRIDGDITMYPWEVTKVVDILQTGIHNLRVLGTDGVDYGITTRMVDDKTATTSTTAAFVDPQSLPKGTDPMLAEQVSGFIGFQQWGAGGLATWDSSDKDWIRVDLVQGIQYEFNALGASSLPATGISDPYLQQLNDPHLTLLDEQGNIISTGELGGQGLDPSLVYRAERSGAYFLQVASASGLNTGAYSLTRTSLDEYGGDINTNGQLNLNTPINGLINSEGDQDWFRISMNSGERLVIELLAASTNNGELHDPWLGIYSSTGQLLISDNNGGRGLDSRLSWAAPTSGTYYVAAGSLGNQGRGSYSLRASRRQDDAPDRLSSAFSYALISPGTSLSGDLEVRSDHDWFQTVLQAGKTYRIQASGERSTTSDYDPLRDPSISLRDSAGRRIAFDDDSGSGLNAELIFRPDTTQRFYLEIQDATDRYDGHYRISVQEASDDFGNTSATAQRLNSAISISIQGRIDYRTDVDLFRLELKGDQVYRLDLRGLSSQGGQLSDPILRLLDGSGAVLATDEDSGIGNDAGLYFFSSSEQTIFLEASAAGDQQGSYTLELSESELPADDHGNSPADCGMLSLGASSQGTLLSHGDSDWFAIQLSAGEHYRFVLEGVDSGRGTLSDPYLELYDREGMLLQAADHGTLSRNAAIGFQPQISGLFYVAARGARPSDTGSYTLTAYAPDEAGDGQASSASLSLGMPKQAGIQSPDDVDWFHFQAQKDQVYTVSITLPSITNGGLPIALAELFDHTGTNLTSADGRFSDGSARLAFKAAETGIFSVAARGYRGRTGRYSIELRSGNSADDAADSVAGSRALSHGESRPGILEVVGDRDWYSIAVEAGHTYRFRLSTAYGTTISPLNDPLLRLLDGGGNELVSNDNQDSNEGVSLDSEIIYIANSNATLYLDAGASGDRWQGAYTLSATDLGELNRDDHPNSSNDDPLVLQNGKPLTGLIETSLDRDLFRLNLDANLTYQLLVRGEASNGGTLTDPQLRLLDQHGGMLAATYDGIGNADASLTIRVSETGSYFLEVSAAERIGNIGSYTAELVELKTNQDIVNDDIPANRSTSTTLEAGKPIEGTLHYSDDVDWIRVELEAGQIYVFDVEPRMINSINGWNPALELIDGNGTRLSSDRDGGSSGAARIIYQANTSGSHYLSIRSQDGSHGIYELNHRRLASGNADPLIKQQWHLANPNGLDLNLATIWQDFSGDGMRIGVIDDGINYAHPDLINNLDLIRDKGATWSRAFDDANLRLAPKPESGHGTAVSGLISAIRNNEKGITGVAFDATIAGFEVDWSIASIASMLRQQLNNSIGGMDVSNNSWGFTQPFTDDFDSPLLEPLAESLEIGVQEGRRVNGEYLGINWVFSAGNSRNLGDNTNYHNFQNSRFVTTVAATTIQGGTSAFSTPGASILVSAFGEDLLTTIYDFRNPNQHNNYGKFSGTSAAAPLVSAVIALMLEANPRLGYRDIQDILAYSARQITAEGFKINGATNWNGGGLHISHDQGFGLVDAHAAVRLAESWSLPARTAANEQRLIWRPDDAGAIPDDDDQGVSFSAMIERELDVEWAEVELDIRHPRIADLIVELISPAGTVARLINQPTATAANQTGSSGEYSGTPDRIVFTTSASLFRGESSMGEWSLRITDQNSGEVGNLQQWGLKLFGSEASENNTYIYTDEFGGFHDEARSLLIDTSQTKDSANSGHDTLNAAALSTASLINLNPGSSSRIAMRELQIASNTWIEDAIAGDGDDIITGNALANQLRGGRGNDRFIASRGDDHISGGPGFDQLIYNANSDDFELIQIGNDWSIIDQRRDDISSYGRQTLSSLERLVFNDKVIDLNRNNRAPIAIGTLPDLGFGTDVLFTHRLNSAVFLDDDVAATTGDSLSYSLKQSDGRPLPGWLHFNASTLELSGEPYDAISGMYSLQLTATDSIGASAALDFNLTVAGTSNNATANAPKSVRWDLDVSIPTNPSLGYSVGDSFDVVIAANDISNGGTDQSVFSAYANLYYNPNLIRAIDLKYKDQFGLFRSGSIDNQSGIIKDLGAALSSFSPSVNTAIASVRFEVLGPGNAELSLRPSLSPYLETTIFGADGDQRALSQYATETLKLTAPRPDIAVNRFEAAHKKAQQGIIELSYEIANYGHTNSQGFWVNLHLSDDASFDSTADPIIWRHYMPADAITGLGSTGLQRLTAQLPRDVLYQHALAEDSINPKFGSISSSKDWLHLSVQAETEAGDSIAFNNTRTLPFTYFPWDVDNNGRVTMADAIAMVNRIGPAPLQQGLSQLHDLNGDAFVTQSEVMAVVDRIGLNVNTNF
ncbi:MAG: hypothetical protein RLZZ611_1543, partial [Cyanobacteriota bacterium]